MGIGRFAFTPLSPSIRDDGLLGIADGGVLASVHFLGYWLGAVFATKLRSSPKATLRISPIAIGIRTLAMGRAAMDCSFGAVIQQRFVPRSPLIERWLAALPRIAKSLETAYSKTDQRKIAIWRT
jgi:hypothetical protein